MTQNVESKNGSKVKCSGGQVSREAEGQSLDALARKLGVYGFEISQILEGRRVAIANCDHLVVDFATNCPFGINEMPEVRMAAIEAVSRYGGLHSSIAAARATTGMTSEVISRIGAMKGSQSSARLYPTTLSANSAVGCAIQNSKSQIVIDPYAHATMMAAINCVPADRKIVSKNPIGVAKEFAATSTRTVYLLGDGLYSMGKFADFDGICDFLSTCPNGRVWLDDAHSVGLRGRDGRGEAMERLSEFEDRSIVTGSLGKAFGAAGGFAVGPQSFINEMLKASVADRFSCNVTLAAQGAILAAMRLLADPTKLKTFQRSLETRLARFDELVLKGGIVTEQHNSPIAFRLLPCDGPIAAIRIAGKLLAAGFMTTPVYFPTIARDKGGIRVSLSCSHSEQDVEQIADLLVSLI